MKILYRLIVLLMSINAFSTYCIGQTDSLSRKIFEDLQTSYINANVPEKPRFDTILKKDLEHFFRRKYGKITVQWEFLREGATQSGTAYPKYYLWTKISRKGHLLDEGATRIAAIEKDQFDVTDFIPMVKIKNKETDIYQIFPVAVCERIMSYL